MNSTQELKLVERAKEDIHAFKEIYEYYFPKIFAYLMNRLPDRETCEDICSEIFIDSISAIKKFEVKNGARFGSLIYRIAHNKTVDYYKKRKPHSAEEISDKQMKSELNSEEQAQTHEHKQNIAFVLSKIKPRYQLIISLKYFSEMDNPEIAEIMNLKPRQVAVTLHRAHKAFKTKYGNFFPGSEIF